MGQGRTRLGILEGSDQIVAQIPGALDEITFDDPQARRSLAKLVGTMLEVFESGIKEGDTTVFTEGNCEWAARSASQESPFHPIAAACFTSKGTLEKLVLGR